jgi:hypothetical protein
VDETDQRPPLVVCDAGPLIHLDELGCLDLLVDFPVVMVPAEVWGEVQRYRPSALGESVVALRQLTPTQPVPPALVAMARLVALHAGEMEALRNRQLSGVLPTRGETGRMVPIVHSGDGGKRWQRATDGRGAAPRSGRV